MNAVEILIVFAGLGYALYRWSTKDFKIFERRGVAYEKPLPLLGNAAGMMQNKDSIQKRMLELYNRTKQHKIFGFFNFMQPIFVINDRELMRQIAIKDFDVFPNHHSSNAHMCDSLTQNILSLLRDQKWRDIRQIMTPAFTGSKMRGMLPLMMECFDECIAYLKEVGQQEDSFEVEFSECFERLANDVIASTAFGLKVNSYQDKNNEFFTLGQLLLKGQFVMMLKFIAFSIVPKVCQYFGMSLFPESIRSYFTRLVLDAMKERERRNIVRPDMINLLMEAKRENQHLSNEEIVAQCFVFFFAAFQNNSNLMCTASQELMANPEVQEKLYEEIMATEKALDGNRLDYETLNGMKYLDMVVAETLRKWPLSATLDRECSADYTATDDDGNELVKFRKGDQLWFNIIGVQWDEENFPNPSEFRPERFSEENKDNIKPYSYIPFGLGPRACIGNRYALMQSKAMLYYLLKHFKLERSTKSTTDIWEDARGFTLTPPQGFWFTLSKRQQASEL